MPMYWNDDQQMLADSARPFLADKAPVSHLRALRDGDNPDGFSRDLWREFADMGFAGLLVGEDDGGLGLGHVEAGVVLEEIGRNLSPSPFLATSVGAVTALKAGSPAARQAWLPGIVAGETVASLALDEGARHRPHRVATRAERSGNGFRIDGAKNFAVQAQASDLLIVSARTAGSERDADGISLFAIPRTAPGVTLQSERLVDSGNAARVVLEGVEVDGDAVLGEIDRGSDTLGQVLGAVRAGSSAELVGLAEGASGMTMGYLRERKQFGRIIGSFQALQHRAAHLYCEIEVARAATLKAQQLLDGGSPEAGEAASVAKAMTGMASALAVQEAIQMHGGIGMTDEHDIGFYMKRQRVLAEMFGDSDFHAEVLAQAAGY